MAMHLDAICVGEAKIDAFMTLHDATHDAHIEGPDLCFRYGGKVAVDEYDLLLGGNAANVATGLSRLGLRTTLFAEIGDDELSIRIHNQLAKEHIDRSNIIHTKNQVSSMSVVINVQGDRTIFSQHVTREHDFQFEDMTATFLFLTSLGNDWQTPYDRALDFAIKNKIKIAFNPGGLQLRTGKELLHRVIRHADILFLNKEEAERILYGADLKDKDAEVEYMKVLTSGLSEMGAKMVVLTNGKNGSYVLDTDGKLHHEPIRPGKVVERTGAGDSYTSGFLSAIMHGCDVKTAMDWGTENATAVVGKIGAQTGLLNKAEMEKKIHSFKK